MANIEKIKAEIERLKELHRIPTFPGDKYEEGCVNGYQLALDKLLSFIESLEKEQPKRLDEAADLAIKGIWPIVICGAFYFTRPRLLDAFKAGVKWMTEQGVSFEYEVEDETLEPGYGKLVGLNPIINLPDSFDVGDKVIVQIRKKEER